MLTRRGFLGALAAIGVGKSIPLPAPSAVRPTLTIDPLKEVVADSLADHQRQYNYMASQCVEMITLAPLAPWTR